MMFDTRLNLDPERPVTGGKALRAIGWHELIVRINAARDFRQVLASDGGAFAASFGDTHVGSPVLRGSDPVLRGQGKRDINLDALSGLKACEGIGLRAETDAAESDREI